jgi:hypothetical protein
MGVRRKKKIIRSVKRKVRIKPLPVIGEATETEISMVQTESRPL